MRKTVTLPAVAARPRWVHMALALWWHAAAMMAGTVMGAVLIVLGAPHWLVLAGMIAAWGGVLGGAGDD